MGSTPFGYDTVHRNGDRKLVVNEKGKLLRKAFKWEAKEGLSNIEIIKRLKKLGETPLALSQGDLGDSDLYNLSIQKEGYESHEFILERRTLNAKAEIFANLQKLQETQGLVQSEGGIGEKQQRRLASIQSQLLQNNFEQAEVLARNFLDANPYSAVGWNLLGNAYLLQNQNQLALKAYSRALEFDPENQDTQKMVQFLRVEPLRRDR